MTLVQLEQNVMEDQDAPWQGVLGCFNPFYCVCCSLAPIDLCYHAHALSSPLSSCSVMTFELHIVDSNQMTWYKRFGVSKS